jgi:hypothetical protein
MQSWFVNAKRISSLDAEICFLLQNEFYFGPDRFPEDRERFIALLKPPSISLAVPSMVRSSEVVNNEVALATYYQQVILLAREHRLPFNSYRHHFWLRLWLWNTPEQVHVSFPWYDTNAEIQRVLDSLLACESGPVYDDEDQGWAIEMHASEGLLFIRAGDPDDEAANLSLCVPRDAFVDQVSQLQTRSRTVIASLSSALGADLWTEYVRGEPVFSDPKG